MRSGLDDRWMVVCLVVGGEVEKATAYTTTGFEEWGFFFCRRLGRVVAVACSLRLRHIPAARAWRFQFILVESARVLSDSSSITRPTTPPAGHVPSRSTRFAMWILPFIGYVGILLGFAFLTLAIGT